MSGPYNFLWIPASAAIWAAVNPNFIKTLFPNGWWTFFINGKPTFVNGTRILPGNLPDCIIFDIWVFDSFEYLANFLLKLYKDLQFVYWLVVIYENLYEELVSSLDLSIKFDITLKQNKIYNTLTVSCEKSNSFFISSRMKSIAVFRARPKFLVKLTYCIAFG